MAGVFDCDIVTTLNQIHTATHNSLKNTQKKCLCAVLTVKLTSYVLFKNLSASQRNKVPSVDGSFPNTHIEHGFPRLQYQEKDKVGVRKESTPPLGLWGPRKL